MDFKSLVKTELSPKFKQICLPKFKIQSGSLPDELIAPHSISARVAEMVAYACKPEFQALPNSPELIRNEILKTRPTVDLEGLLNYCWLSCRSGNFVRARSKSKDRTPYLREAASRF